MCGLFRNKYHTGSARYGGYDYSLPGMYYITICTKNKVHYFGEVENGKMIFTEVGEIAAEEWLKTPMIRSDMNLSLGEYVIMPDHIHGIITIGTNQYNIANDNCFGAIRNPGEDDSYVEINTFGPQSKNLASIIRGYKSAVTSRARAIERNDLQCI